MSVSAECDFSLSQNIEVHLRVDTFTYTETNKEEKEYIHARFSSLPGMTAPAGGVCEDEVVDCENYGRAVCTEFASWAQVNCAKFCGLCCECIQLTSPPI